MNKNSKKISRQPPPMTDFEFAEVVSILLGVKPKVAQKSQKQKYSKKSEKMN